MEDQNISFKTAKLAKEIGFNWQCNKSITHYLSENKHEFDGTSGPFGWKKDEKEINDGFFINNYKGIDYSNESQIIYGLPTQTNLRNWLRQKYNIDIVVYPIESFKNDVPIEEKGNLDYTYYIVIKGIKQFITIKDKIFDTYELALEDALYETLKKEQKKNNNMKNLIDQELIEKAAKLEGYYFDNYECFKNGVNFAENELKRISIEFALFISKYSSITSDTNYKTIEELFEIFINLK